MFHHVVLLSFKSALNAENHAYIKGVCNDMQRELPGVESVQFVQNVSNRSPRFTHAFVAVFVDEAAHDNYQSAPMHLPLRDKIAELTDSVVVLDYET
ncbi:Dabb family protein [Alcaligenaceae bacterium]|nr:Dabb family protein [Alcaligenaceae bacterium]